MAPRTIAFVVTEATDLSATRAGTAIAASSLTDAKRQATRLQVFSGTTLVIAYPNGARVAVKRRDGKWRNEPLEEG
jgi:hypothetical protein